MKLQKKKSQYIITVPKALVKAKGWKKGDWIFFFINRKGNLEMRKTDKTIPEINSNHTKNGVKGSFNNN